MYGEYLKMQRKACNYSLENVAKATNISKQNLSRYERNEVEPQIHFCVLLADFYGITLDELIGRDFPNDANGNSYTQHNINGNNVMNIKK